MSDCANGGRNVYQPACRIEIKFEGHDVPWSYPMAINGRTIEKVTIGGVEYVPKQESE